MSVSPFSAPGLPGRGACLVVLRARLARTRRLSRLLRARLNPDAAPISLSLRARLTLDAAPVSLSFAPGLPGRCSSDPAPAPLFRRALALLYHTARPLCTGRKARQETLLSNLSAPLCNRVRWAVPAKPRLPASSARPLSISVRAYCQRRPVAILPLLSAPPPFGERDSRLRGNDGGEGAAPFGRRAGRRRGVGSRFRGNDDAPGELRETGLRPVYGAVAPNGFLPTQE